MLDIKLIREQPDLVRAGLRRRGDDPAQVDAILAVDERRRSLIKEVEVLKAERNAVSKEISKLRDATEREAKISAMRAVGDRIAELDQQANAAEAEFQRLLLWLPNLPHADVPDGSTEHDNVVVRVEGQPRQFDFTPKPHWELGEALGIIDFERGVKLSGSRFFVLKGAGSRLQRALITWMLDLHTQQHGYSEITPPYVVKEDVLVGTGNLPRFGENLFRIEGADLTLIPTAEVPVTNLYRDEILEASDLPIFHVAYTPCWRNEQMSAGRDVRGIKRVYQFDKVEMVKFVTPETSYAELLTLVDNAEDVCKALKIPYRLLKLCTADLGTATMKYDLEMWAPGVEEWLEVSSCSNFEAYQSRRANLRYRPSPGAKPEFLHTLNGSGLALPRVMIAIMENYQQPDGTIVVPEVLRPYMGGVEVIG
ncbi:seryl-tRNA synthetase [Oscillochloris trichoides DG-6]|uniref:Serine--tRNA ligase n=1 Tax=Oscillochloris trichoides DG-6 TaxID=765420 RepID=E1IHA7_9CHLR|nr:serine--tRNA ligase [Oscillochloris trichoides]EFO79582.1 seryl-tRNA synthetase [Oscillochloris trichoides DG-6]